MGVNGSLVHVGGKGTARRQDGTVHARRDGRRRREAHHRRARGWGHAGVVGDEQPHAQQRRRRADGPRRQPEAGVDLDCHPRAALARSVRDAHCSGRVLRELRTRAFEAR